MSNYDIEDRVHVVGSVKYGEQWYDVDTYGIIEHVYPRSALILLDEVDGDGGVACVVKNKCIKEVCKDNIYIKTDCNNSANGFTSMNKEETKNYILQNYDSDSLSTALIYNILNYAEALPEDEQYEFLCTMLPLSQREVALITL